MQKQTPNIAINVFVCLVLLLSALNLKAQDTAAYASANKPFSIGHSNETFSKSHVFIGTQIPLQFTAGYEYNFSNRISARVQAGFITEPYSGIIPDIMEALGMDKYLSKVIKKAFNSGTIISIGPNYHFGRNYVGIFGQYMHLNGGGITAADALSVYLKRDVSQSDLSSLPVFEFSAKSNLVNAGALLGHEFRLHNPKFSIKGEIGLSKIVSSKNSFASSLTLIDQTSFAQNIYKQIDQEVKDAYRKYGYIPTINLYLVYHL